MSTPMKVPSAVLRHAYAALVLAENEAARARVFAVNGSHEQINADRDWRLLLNARLDFEVYVMAELGENATVEITT